MKRNERIDDALNAKTSLNRTNISNETNISNNLSNYPKSQEINKYFKNLLIKEEINIKFNSCCNNDKNAKDIKEIHGNNINISNMNNITNNTYTNNTNYNNSSNENNSKNNIQIHEDKKLFNGNQIN